MSVLHFTTKRLKSQSSAWAPVEVVGALARTNSLISSIRRAAADTDVPSPDRGGSVGLRPSGDRHPARLRSRSADDRELGRAVRVSGRAGNDTGPAGIRPDVPGKSVRRPRHAVRFRPSPTGSDVDAQHLYPARHAVHSMPTAGSSGSCTRPNPFRTQCSIPASPSVRFSNCGAGSRPNSASSRATASPFACSIRSSEPSAAPQ